MVYTVQSTRSLAEIEWALQDSAARHQFGILTLTVHDLRQTMKNKDTALPCRISVYGAESNYSIATLLPRAMMDEAAGAAQ